MKKFAIVLCTAIAVGGFAAPAHASVQPGWADPATERDYVLALEAHLSDATPLEVARISAGDRELLRKYAQVASVTETYSVTLLTTPESLRAGVASAGLCYTATSTRIAKGIVGNVLYKSWHVGRWCRSGSTVISASRVEQGWQSFWLGWSGKVLIAGSAAVVSNQGRSYSQHSFQYQLGTPSPTQYTQPCTRIRGTASPGYFADFTCGVYS